ncbi:MAG: hypothetical protein MK132_14595 [Lentisphaerales bacterium]|nr:hypothetical protein [Lentisphaerales bacterium]
MKKVNVNSNRKPGRTTQYMSENFSDLADLANNILLKGSSDLEKKYETLKEMYACIELLLEKSDHIPVPSKLSKILAKIESAGDELYEYMQSSKP